MADIRKLDYLHLRVFAALLEERSVTKTARSLELTQPTVSAMLKKLRLLFDDPLFLRTQRGVTPTAKAESMATEVREILDRLQSLGTDPAFDPHTAQRTFSIVARDFSQVVIIFPFIAQLQQQCPGIRIAIHALPMEDAVERMAGGSVDVSVSSLRYSPRHLQRRLILQEPYVCVVDPRSRLARKPFLTADDLCSTGHVSASPMSLAIGDPVTELFAAEGIERNVRVAVDGYLLLPRLLQGTELVAIVPESLVRCSGIPLMAFPMPIRFPNLRIALLWHQRVHNEPGNVWLRERLIAYCDERSETLEPVV